MTTYNRGDEAINDSELYDDLFDKRGVTKVTQYTTKVFGRAIKNLTIGHTLHYWSHGDRYHKLASQYYNNFRLWWIIALFNEKPSEANINYGEAIKIPHDYESILLALGE